MGAAEPLVILDTSVLINYAHVDRLDLLAGCFAEIRVVEQVQSELQRENQKQLTRPNMLRSGLRHSRLPSER